MIPIKTSNKIFGEDEKDPQKMFNYLRDLDTDLKKLYLMFNSTLQVAQLSAESIVLVDIAKSKWLISVDTAGTLVSTAL
jgi:hypothetical protein